MLHPAEPSPADLPASTGAAALRLASWRAEWREPTRDEIAAVAERVRAAEDVVDPVVFGRPERRPLAIAWRPTRETMGCEPLDMLLAYWQGLADGRAPPVSAFDCLDVRLLLGRLMLLDAVDEGFDATYRVYGTVIAYEAGRDWTGWSLSAMNRKAQTSHALFYRACYRAAYLRPEPLFTEHGSPPYLAPRSWKRLILPLLGPDGRVARFLVGNLAIDSRLLTHPEEEMRRAHLR